MLDQRDEASREFDLIYVGFWRRLAAYAIDFLILLPYALLSSFFLQTTKWGFVFGQVRGFALAILFEVYLVRCFGGSPGKLFMGVRIAKTNGVSVGYKEAWLRYSVLLIIATLSSIGLIISLTHVPNDEFSALSFKTRIKHLEAGTPSWFQPLQIVGSVWIYSEFLVLFTNKQRRALHDFLAGTVVIRRIPPAGVQAPASARV